MQPLLSNTETNPGREYARLCVIPELAGMECLSAHFWGHRFAPHVHDSYVIALIERGAERFHHGRTEHIAGAGSIVLLNPGAVHTGQRGTDEGWSYRAFYPPVELLASLGKQLGIGQPDFRHVVVDDPLMFHALREAHVHIQSEPDALARQAAWVETCGALLQRHAGAQRSRPDEAGAVAQVRAIMADAYGEPLSLSALAQAVGLSTWQLSRAFRQHTGLPVHAWRNQIRLSHARTLLRQRRPIAEVANALGFADQAHFTRHFKRAFGFTPGHYRALA
ncbi:MAG: AraC family transcriptional regulator [Betaproteobacteria bacterium]|nr:AraC family transcriptional regulator [Betaproteobacteria bacterium]